MPLPSDPFSSHLKIESDSELSKDANWDKRGLSASSVHPCFASSILGLGHTFQI